MEVRVENRNPEMNEGPTREAVQQLASMFPNVPLGVIRNEMVRAGSMQPAIERLLALSSTYPVRVPERPPRNPTPSIHKNTLQSIAQQPLAESATPPLRVDPEAWSKDSGLRERLLLQKKQEMLLKARRRFFEREKQSEASTMPPSDHVE